ncbi:metal-dependent hydrolase [Candidatus Nanosalina sp. VS9-1]|uniref:metal-dependent hydrolase n=1 Tax=Candidatus Nanosalina sp. VS9-1 TaxID=3388566 RepID=UPI0039E0CB9B
MLGRQHLMLSVATATVLLIPFIQSYQGFVLVAFVGTAIGSLIPDVDAADASVFHRHIRGLDSEPGKAVGSFIGPVLPVFGYTTKYMIYRPLVWLFNLFSVNYSFHDSHRSFSHSIIGVFAMTSVTGLYISPVLMYLGFFSVPHLAVFLSAYAFGALLHMLEDSCTKSGIAWNEPFSSRKLKGDLTTGEDIRKPRILLYMLGGLTVPVFYLSFVSSRGLELFEVSLLSFALVSLAWIIFMAFVDVRIE